MRIRNPRRVFWWAAYELLASRIPNWLPSLRWLRAYCASRYYPNVSETAAINRKVRLSRECTVCDHAGLGEESVLMGDVHIGAGVIMGPGCYFITGDHPVPADYGRFRELKSTTAPIHVEDDVFLGGRVIVLPGVRIGRGAAVGAGSVVTRDVAPGATVAGNPAREIRRRKV
jgi:maltose O-acetyltransferase